MDPVIKDRVNAHLENIEGVYGVKIPYNVMNLIYQYKIRLCGL